MRAAYYERAGGARDVLVVGELPTPEPGPGEVRVRLATSGVNPSDVKSRRAAATGKIAFPRVVPHSDGAGTIDRVGPGVPESRVGERVWTWNAQWQRPHGTAAEFVTLPAAQAVRLPDGVGFDVGACLGIPALTAYHAVATDGGVAGQRVLVQGGAGAVGHYAVQLARLLGARQVLATVSGAEKARLATEAGADVAINYRDEDVVARVKEATGGELVDRVIEVDYAANVNLDHQLVRLDGLVVVYGSGKPVAEVPFGPMIMKNLGVRFFVVYNLRPEVRGPEIDHLTRLLEEGTMRHNVAARLPLERIVEAHEAVEAGAMGNVVVEIS